MTLPWRSGGSLKRRVTVGAVTTCVVALLAVVGVTSAIAPVLLDRSAESALDAAEKVADDLAASNTPPRELLTRVQSESVRAQLTLAGGRELGALGVRSSAHTRTVVLNAAGPPLDGARLTLQFDAPSRSPVLGLLLAASVLAAVLVAAVMPWVARVALAPLDRMTALARDIAGGRRGQRLGAGEDPKLCLTAKVFDGMLDALEGAERRALSSERALRRFVADAAHELRTPIAGISAAAEAVLAHPEGVAPQQQRLLLALGREARHAGRLVEDLLDLARIDTGLTLSLESVDVRRICMEQAERAMLVVPRARVVVQGAPTMAWADPARIGQVVANLVNNACAVTPAGETVHVVVSASPAVVTVTVTDRGPGVPEAQRERIFGRLVRLDVARSSGKGVGLGLTIARGIARAHGGDVVCKAPAPGKRGAVFELVLPVGLGPGPRSVDGGRLQQA